ncbi:MAG: YggT family protein [Aphanocapsa sp. GSE-SYN-MK-11-07L]|jgi:YggT family protein|nr:YggT family protein [Aphanocapsa sp. GSE-SYN-MK-11-07L]
MVSNDIIPLVMTALANFLQIYLLLLIVRILLSWFPNIDWMRQPFSALRQLTDPYLDIFRSFIPPLGGIDFSPILGFVLLNVLISLLGGSSLV